MRPHGFHAANLDQKKISVSKKNIIVVVVVAAVAAVAVAEAVAVAVAVVVVVVAGGGKLLSYSLARSPCAAGVGGYRTYRFFWKAAGYWLLLAAGCYLLPAGCYLLAACCWLRAF